MRLSQLCPSQPGASCEASTKSRGSGQHRWIVVLIRISISPAWRPTATGSSVTCRRGRRAGATSAPAMDWARRRPARAKRRNAAMRSPTCKPTSKTRAPAFTNRAKARPSRRCRADRHSRCEAPLDAAPRALVVGHQRVRSAAASIAGNPSLRRAKAARSLPAARRCRRASARGRRPAMR